MLSIGKLASGQHNYYLDAVARGAEEYYTEAREAPGRWTGRASARLGLSGQVTAGQLGAVLAGEAPGGWLLVGKQGRPRVPGFDCTFSAPKSVSVLWALGPIGVRRQIRDAHDAAVDAAVALLEDEASRARRGRGGAVQVEGDGFVAAAFRHRTSREGDPQLHTHVAGRQPRLRPVRRPVDRPGRPPAPRLGEDRRLRLRGEAAGRADPPAPRHLGHIAEKHCRHRRHPQAGATPLLPAPPPDRGPHGRGGARPAPRPPRSPPTPPTKPSTRPRRWPPWSRTGGRAPPRSGSTTTTGRRVIGASLAARAARQLEEGSGIPSTTLHRLLADLDRPDGGRLGSDHVVVVDEAAMVGTRKLLELVAHADRANAKVVLIADPCQLRAIEAGGAFARLARRADRTALTANRRQREASERQALGDLRSGRADEAPAAYLAHDRVRHDQDPDALRARVVDDWWTATNDGAEAAMLALHRHQVEDLNARARHKRRAAGRLGVDEVVLGESRHAVGDTVLAHRNDPRIGIVNGDRGRITAIHETAHRVDVALDAGTTVSVPFASAETDHLTHGYAMTIHKTQGATIDVALVLVHPSMAISMGPMVATVFGPTVDALAQMAPQVFVSAHLVGWNAKPAIAARLPDPFVRNSVGTRSIRGPRPATIVRR